MDFKTYMNFYTYLVRKHGFHVFGITFMWFGIILICLCIPIKWISSLVLWISLGCYWVAIFFEYRSYNFKIKILENEGFDID